MRAYHTPGVYFESLDNSPPNIDLRRTDIAGFVGIAARGPLHRPLKIESWTQFVSSFGAHIPQAYLAYAVEGFFANGGQTCWVVRVADSNRARPATLELPDMSGQSVLRLTASSPGSWGNSLAVQLIPSTTRFTLRLQTLAGEYELWPDLALEPGHARYAEKILNSEDSGSRLIHVEVLGIGVINAAAKYLKDGNDGLANAVDLTDSNGRPTLRLSAAGVTHFDQTIRVTVHNKNKTPFGLSITRSDEYQEHYDKLSIGSYGSALCRKSTE